MPQPLLRYQLQLSQGQITSLTYINASQTATLTVVVSNPGANVTITSLTFGLGPFGQNATDIAASAEDITPVLPSGWQAVAGTSFTVTPPGGSIVVGTTPLTFAFQVKVNAAAGTALLSITEVSSAGSAFVAPMVITKMPASFALANLSATPTLIEPNGIVTLTWTATPGQLYTVGYPGGTAPVTAPSGGNATWVSPAIQTLYPNVTFTVAASTQVAGQVLSTSASTNVNVDVPQIISFTQPPAQYTTPVTLNWVTVNTDYCVLYANGVVVDPHAPANPGSAGYSAYPSAHVTQYQIQAYRGQTPVSSQPVIVTLYNWAYMRTFSWGDISSMTSLALNADGSVLYFGGTWGVTAIDTNAFAILGQGVINPFTSGPMPYGVAPGGLVLSKDGSKLYAAVLQGQVLVFQTANLSAAPVAIAVNGGPLVLSPDGTRLYSVAGQFSGQPGIVYAINTQTNAISNQVNLGNYGGAIAMKISRDGSTLYVLGENVQDESACPLFTINTSSFAATRVSSAPATPMALTLDGATLYTGAPAGRGGITTSVQSLAVPGFTVKSTMTPIALPAPPSQDWASIIGMAADPSGGLFVSIVLMGVYIDGQNVPSVLYFINPATGVATQMTTLGLRPNAAGVVVDSAGKRAYYAEGREIVVFSSSGGGARALAVGEASEQVER